MSTLQVESNSLNVLGWMQKFGDLILGKHIPVLLGKKACTNGDVVYMPPTVKGTTEKEKIKSICLLLHEYWHNVYHSNTSIAPVHKYSGLLFTFFNCFEDIRIERAGIKQYPGSIEYFERFYRDIMDQYKNYYINAKMDKYGAVAFLHALTRYTILRARGNDLGIKDTEIPASDELIKSYDKYMKDLEPKIKHMKKCSDAFALAQEFMTRVEKLIEDEKIKRAQEEKKRRQQEEKDDETNEGSGSDSDQKDNNEPDDQSGDVKPDEGDASESKTGDTDDKDTSESDTGTDPVEDADSDPSEDAGDSHADEDPEESDGVNNNGSDNDDDTGDPELSDDQETDDDARPDDDDNRESPDGERDDTDPNNDEPNGCTDPNNETPPEEQPGDESTSGSPDDKVGDEEDKRDDGGVPGEEPTEGTRDDEDNDKPESDAATTTHDPSEGGSPTGDKDVSPASDDPTEDRGEDPEEEDDTALDDDEMDEVKRQVEDDMTRLNEDEGTFDEFEDYKRELTEEFINGDEYIKAPGVIDEIVKSESWAFMGTHIRDEGIKLLGQETADMARVFINNTRPHKVRHQRRGRLDFRSLCDPRDGLDVFTKTYAGALEQSAVMLVKDNSGSMDGAKATIAAQVLSGLLYHLDRAAIPCAAIGYTDTNFGYCDDNKIMRDFPVHLEIYKEFEETFTHEVMTRVHPPSFSCNTPDLDALREYAVPKLMERKEKRKVLLIICDGEPCTWGDKITKRLKASYKRYIKALKEEGIKVCGFGIEANISEYFEDDWIPVSPSTLGKNLIDNLDLIKLSCSRCLRKSISFCIIGNSSGANC